MPMMSDQFQLESGEQLIEVIIDEVPNSNNASHKAGVGNFFNGATNKVKGNHSDTLFLLCHISPAIQND